VRLKPVLVWAVFFLSVACSAFFGGSAVALAGGDDDVPAVYYRRAALEGRVITYDPERDLFIVFGSYQVDEDGWWREVDSSKFHRVLVHPTVAFFLDQCYT